MDIDKTERIDSMIIGITGGIASGKSEVCKILERNGFVKIDADIVAHDVLENPEIIERVKEIFGNEVIISGDDGECIDRKKLGSIVFSDKNKMDILEGITHPQIIKQIEGIINKERKNYVIEAIKLVSSGLINLCDELWVVYAEPEQQLNRLIKHRNMSYEDALSRLKTQEEHDWDISKADRIIYSTEPIENMEKQVVSALKNICEE